MISIVSLFWQISTLRLGPDKVPVDKVFTWFVILVFILADFSYALFFFPQVGMVEVAMIVVLNLAVLAGAIFLMLYLFRTTYRFQGTLVAILGADTIITLIALPCALVQLFIGVEALEGFLEFTKFIFFSWHFCIIGFVFSRSFDINIMLGFILTATLFILTFAIDLMVFPGLSSKS